MPRFEPPQVRLSILTEREGLLARAGHDLRLEAEDFSVERDDEVVRVIIAAASVIPVCARRGDADAPGLLSDADLRRIASNLHADVLQSARHPIIRVEVQVEALDGASGGATLHKAMVHLRGRSAKVRVRIERHGARLRGEATLLQSAFGIEPFATMLGAIRVADAIDVRFEAPAALIDS